MATNPGTRTAPTVNGTVTKSIVTISAIDASGDKYADSYVTSATPLDLDVEALVAAYQGATQASVYSVSVAAYYVGDADPDNAYAGFRGSVKDGVNELWRDEATLSTQSTRLVAPVPECMQGNQDIPLLTATEFLALIAAQGTILADYALQSAQFTERRERANNPKIKA